MSDNIIDIHTHILPQIDDGSQSVSETIQMIEIAMQMGIYTMIATPHTTASLSEVVKTKKEIDGIIQKKFPNFSLFLGQEILYDSNTIYNIKKGNILTLAESRYVLIEFFEQESFMNILNATKNIKQNNYTPILAHVERYQNINNDEKILLLKKCGCLLQVNFNSLLQRHNRCNKQLKNYICSGIIDFLSTDMHNNKDRTPNIAKELKWLNKNINQTILSNIMYKNAINILQS